ncbi:MAG: glutamate racemase [Lentisphaerae bacterium]|nr:MAG: glutamate racemase [Lentisphaerota bacterium]
MCLVDDQRADNRPIGIFDSGLGGLTVVRAIRNLLPHEDIIYLGDNARVPYGSRSKETICRYAIDDLRFLLAKEVKLVVVACNTVATTAMEALQKLEGDVPILDVVQAGVMALFDQLSVPRKVLILGTRATINSDAYRLLIHRRSPQTSVRSQACPLFVPLVEEGIDDESIVLPIIHYYLDKPLLCQPDAIILGCTHYPLLKKEIAKVAARIQLIDSAEATAQFLRRYLEEHQGLAAFRRDPGVLRCFVTDMPLSFHHLASRFLGYQPDFVEKIQFDDTLQ